MSNILSHEVPSLAGTRSLFKLLNNPPTIAQLSIPPQTPILIRQGCLISLYSNDSTKVSLTKQFVNLYNNIRYNHSIQSSRFIQLKSPHSFNALISTNNSTNKNIQTSLYHLNLSGETDWQIWGKDSIVAMEQNTSLSITNSDSLQFNKYQKSQFNVVKGRGNLILNGQGSIMEMVLKNSYDEILIDYKNLLAINGKSQIDIKESISNQLVSNNKYTSVSSSLPSIKDTQTSQVTFGSVFKYTVALTKKFVDLLKRGYDISKYGTPVNFIQIKGPRTVLIQSYNNSILDNNMTYQLQPLLEDKPKQISKIQERNLENSNLSFAYVEPNGRVEFKKTLKLVDSDI